MTPTMNTPKSGGWLIVRCAPLLVMWTALTLPMVYYPNNLIAKLSGIGFLTAMLLVPALIGTLSAWPSTKAGGT